MPVIARYLGTPLDRLARLGKASVGRPVPVRKDEREDVLNAIADALRPKAKARLVRELNRVLSDKQLARLAASVKQGKLSALQQLLPAYDPDDPGPWAELRDSYEATVRQVARQAGQKALGTYGIDTAFNVSNPYTQRWLTERTGALITEISEDARANIRSLVEAAWTNGIPPEELAELIRPHLGLTTQQAAAVDRRFGSTYGALQDEGMSTAEAASEAADRTRAYAEDLLDQRAETVARTETIAASTAGTHDAWSDAKDQGLLPDDIQREWVASPEGLGACHWCEELDGQRVGFDEPFETDSPSVNGTIDRPPLHPRCRCVVRLIVPGLNDAESLDDIREMNAQETE